MRKWPEANGEMAARIREFDWASTSLGPIQGWPQSLKTIVDLMLASRSMMSLVWGSEAIHLYNDSFTDLLREHRGLALGRSAYETFARSHDVFEADIAAGMAGQSVRLPAQRYPVLRQGRLEDAWFDVDYAPIRDDVGAVGGVLWTLKETTAQHQAEQALRASEARHRLLIESWTQAVWETSADGVVVADSPSWRAYTGQTLEEWLGYGWLDAIHPDDRAYAARQWREAVADHGLVNAEFRLRTRGGGWRWTNVRAAPVLDPEGRIEKWAGMNIDIDARRRAETALRENEERQAFLLQLSDALAPLACPADIQTAATRFLAEKLNVSWCYFNEFDDRQTHATVLRDFHRDDLLSMAGVHDLSGERGFLDLVRSGAVLDMPDLASSEHFSAQAKATYGGLGIRSALGAPLLRTGHLVAVLLAADTCVRTWTRGDGELLRSAAERTWAALQRARAAEALRESEEKYRTLFDAIDEGFCVIEVLFDLAGQPADYVFLETNAAFERQTGLANAVGRRMRELAPDHERHWFETYGRIAVSGESQRFELPAEALGRWYDVYAFRIGDPEQRRVAILFNDVAERKQAECELRESEERQTFLLALSDALRPLADAGEIQATTTRLLGAHLGVDRAMYAEVTGEPGAETGVIRGQFIRPSAPGRPAPDPFPDHFTYETFGADVMARRYSGEGLVVADVDADTEFDATERAAWDVVGVRAAIVAPLVKGNRLVAELGVHSETSRTWTDAEVSLVREAGERTWAAAERARAEAALHTSERRYHSLFQSMDEAYAVVEVLEDGAGTWTDFRFVEVNAAFMHHTGMPYPVGRTATELLGTPNPRWAQMYGQALDTGEPLRVQESELTLGRTFDLNIFSLEPALNRVAVLFTDITERKLAEAELRASEERFRLLLQNVRDYAIFTTDTDGIITTWPAGAAAVYGWSEAEMLGRSVDLTFTPEDVARGAPMAERETAIREGLAPNVRWHMHKDGTRIFIDGSTQPLVGADGQIRGFIKIGQDVTEARRVQQALTESEERLRTLMEGIPQLVWRSVDEGVWTWASPQWRAFTGQCLDASLGRGWLEAVHPADRDDAMQAWAKAPGEGAIDVDYRVRRAADGEYLWHHTRSLPVRNKDGLIVEWLGTSTDVHAIRGLQARQEVLVNELQHRVRNLLGVVTAVAGRTLREGGSVDAFEERLQALSRAQGLLSQQGSDTVEVGSLVRAELAAYAQDGSDRVYVAGPEVQLTARQVQNFALALHELTTNAVKYGGLKDDNGWLRVTWEVVRDRRGRHRLALRWTESGVAVRPQTVTRRGYGTELIQEALAYALEADVEYELGSDGVRCRIEMPVGQPE